MSESSNGHRVNYNRHDVSDRLEPETVGIEPGPKYTIGDFCVRLAYVPPGTRVKIFPRTHGEHGKQSQKPFEGTVLKIKRSKRQPENPSITVRLTHGGNRILGSGTCAVKVNRHGISLS